MAGFSEPVAVEDGRPVQSITFDFDQKGRFSRSPHPYHRRGSSLLDREPESARQGAANDEAKGYSTARSSSESGTEADDERGRLLRSLPAPPSRYHKGLRNAPFEDATTEPSPMGTPPASEATEKEPFSRRIGNDNRWRGQRRSDRQSIREEYTKRKRSEIVRRITETILFIVVGLVASRQYFLEGRLIFYSSAIIYHIASVLVLFLLYPIRGVYQAKRTGYSLHESLSRVFHIPSRFDPAPLLYPVFLPLLVSISLASTTTDFILPNIILGLSSLSPRLVPFDIYQPDFNVFHWLLTILPLAFSQSQASDGGEALTLLYPIHFYTYRIIEFLTTTSLELSELHLLASILTDLYMFATSAQAQILKALLWLGTMLLFITCRKPLTWELALARVPSWRFRESIHRSRSSRSLLQTLDRTVCSKLVQLIASHKPSQSYDSEGDEDSESVSEVRKFASRSLTNINGLTTHPTTSLLDHPSVLSAEPNPEGQQSDCIVSGKIDGDITIRRRYTLPAMGSPLIQNHKNTASGRPKRSLTRSSQSFLNLTPAQAATRKWVYAIFVYAATLYIILGPIRIYVSRFSLQEREPFGWALGYLFGDISPFRSWVSARGLDVWVPLPGPFHRAGLDQPGWVEQLRQNTLGPANMRLLLCLYCLFVLLVGMTVVLQLSSMAEVDTRRKVFHGTMVAMLLPTVFIDPCFTSLALTLILAIFLLLDLFRAAQLPPVSRPLTAFLAPYVDGRDHRGPVIVSHIFLLIGCAIPLWLSLAAVGRSGQEPWAGWDVDARDMSMLCGVICVGMGDSAASLIGRRYGRHKWYWGGGKSLEGSLAFVVAVTVGLIAAYIWLRAGGWVSYGRESPGIVLGKAWLAASGASLTEAVLTGANDNVVVPVALWLLVRGLKL